MSSPFGKKLVPGSTQAELDRRGTQLGVTWASKRMPWIHVTSLSSGCGGKFATLSSKANAPLYETNYVRPLPVVTGVDVKKQGELGTTRKATIKLTAFSDDQLRELQKCYFIPGMGCRVEWGWNVDAAGTKALGPIGLGKDTADPIAICAMNKRAESQTHYAGIQGIVANFSYNLTRDNTWDCSIEVIAASEAVGGSKVATYNCPDCAREYKNEENGEEKSAVENKSDLYTFFHDLWENFETAKGKYLPGLQTVASQDGKTAVISQFTYLGPQRNDKGGDDSSWYEGGLIGAVIGNQVDATEAYISYATLEAAINRFCIPTTGGKYTIGKLSSNNMTISNHPKLESSDPRVCIIPGTPKSGVIASAGTAKNSTGFFANLSPAATIGRALMSAGGEQATSAISDKGIILDNIMINTVFLMLELDSVESGGDPKLITFLQNVLRKINECCGNLWEFEVVSTSEDCANPKKVPTISVIDAKIYDPAPTYQVPSKAIGGKASALRELKLDMKMTENMKTQALYAGGSKQQKAKTESGGNCGANALKGFTMGNSYKNLAAPPATDPPKCDCEGAAPNEKKPSFDELFSNLGEEVNDTTASAARSAIIEAYGKSVNAGDDEHCKGMIVPFEFSFTTDGIGGFSFGQMVSSDRIPSEVRSAYEWQVTSVEHSITSNDWTTTVNTVMRYK
jgi:hypothetical protein